MPYVDVELGDNTRNGLIAFNTNFNVNVKYEIGATRIINIYEEDEEGNRKLIENILHCPI